MVSVKQINRQIGELEEIANQAHESFKEAVDTNHPGFAAAARTCYTYLAGKLIEVCGLLHSSEDRSDNLLERYELQSAIAALPSGCMADNYPKKASRHPSLEKLKKAVDNKKIPYKDIGSMARQLARANRYDIVLEALEYARQKTLQPHLRVEYMQGDK
jgi:hypothetical protein